MDIAIFAENAVEQPEDQAVEDIVDDNNDDDWNYEELDIDETEQDEAFELAEQIQYEHMESAKEEEHSG